MKKILLVSISIICIITFNVSLTGCANIKNKSGIPENHPATTSKTNGTSILNASPASATVMPTQPSSSPSGDNIKEIDYDQYLKKIWVVKSWNGGAYDYSSFFISKIKNGVIEGKLSTSSIAKPDFYFYSLDPSKYLGDLSGTIKNGVAECQFSDKVGNKGNVTLSFKENNNIEATIKYTDKGQAYKNLSLDGNYLFRPYNLVDIDGFAQLKDQSFKVDLNTWGNVNFVSGKQDGGKNISMKFYLTNEEGDILYDFGSVYPNNLNVKAVSFPDINKDGFKDVIIIIADAKHDDVDNVSRIYFQKNDGTFYYDEKLNVDLNISGNNTDIKTITDYLSKKF